MNASICNLEQHRVFTDEELSHGIPVEESRRRVTELIFDHYNQMQSDFFTADEAASFLEPRIRSMFK